MYICICRQITEEDARKDPDIFEKRASITNCGSCCCERPENMKGLKNMWEARKMGESVDE